MRLFSSFYKSAILAAVLAGLAPLAQANTYKWQGASGGSWATASNWLSGDGTTTNTAGTAPTATDDVVLDNSSAVGSYTVKMDTVTNNCKSLRIGYTGNVNTITFQFIGTAVNTVVLTIAGGTGDDLIVDQGGRFEDLLITTGGTGNLAVTTGDTIRVKNGGYFYLSSPTGRSFSTPFPATGNNATTFESNSTIEFNAPNTTALTVSGRNYGNVIYSGSGTLTNSVSSPTTFTGTVTCASGITLAAQWTGTAYCIFKNNIVNSSNNFLLTSTLPVTYSGAITQSGTGAVKIDAGALIPSGSSLTLNSPLIANGTTTVSGTLLGGTGSVSGAGKVIVASGATLGVQSASGINGQITTTGGNTYSSGATYLYNGSSVQVTGASLPASANTLTFNNAAGVTLTNNATASSQLNLTSGIVSTGANTLTAPDANIVVGTGTVNGTLIRSGIDATALTTHAFPLSTASGRASVFITVTGAGSGTGTFTVKVTQGSEANLASPANDLGKFWTITPTGFTGNPTATLTFNYAAGDVNGNEANYVVGEWNGSNWIDYTPTNAATITTDHFATITGVSTFSDWAVGEVAALPVELSSFTAE